MAEKERWSPAVARAERRGLLDQAPGELLAGALGDGAVVGRPSRRTPSQRTGPG